MFFCYVCLFSLSGLRPRLPLESLYPLVTLLNTLHVYRTVNGTIEKTNTQQSANGKQAFFVASSCVFSNRNYSAISATLKNNLGRERGISI